jgi:1D-myo-inositol-tetrakisphosphate 5-kinase/inositol-polyphosphate multikinase
MRSSSSSRTLASEVFGEALAQLRGLRRWFATQRELHLLGSSVLITYEGDARFPTRPRVCVIDFCNYVEAHGETDENFARGLDRLAEMMEEIVAERREAGGGEGNGV